MLYQTIEVRKLNPVIGAEISGIDLSRDLGNQQFEEVHDALMENLVIFFRNQNMTVEQHKAFGQRFGKLHVHPNAPQELADHPEILVIKADENSKHVAGRNGTATSPAMKSRRWARCWICIRCHRMAGATPCLHMYAAFEALSTPLQRMLEGLTAIHDSAKAHGYRIKAGDRSDMHFPRAMHPVVRTHPVTGRKALYVNRGFTTRITQLRLHESTAMLEMLFRHCETPEFMCRFRWQPNSVAF
jgi:taurine dioxygenase